MLSIFSMYLVSYFILKNNHTFISNDIQSFEIADTPKPIMDPANNVFIKDALEVAHLYMNKEDVPFTNIPFEKDKFMNEVNQLQEKHIFSDEFKEQLISNSNITVKLLDGENAYLYEINIGETTYKIYQIFKQKKFMYVEFPKADITYTQEKIEAILSQYIEYLGLNYINDWVFKNNMFFSSQASVNILFEEHNGMITVKLQSQ